MHELSATDCLVPGVRLRSRERLALVLAVLALGALPLEPVDDDSEDRLGDWKSPEKQRPVMQRIHRVQHRAKADANGVHASARSFDSCSWQRSFSSSAHTPSCLSMPAGDQMGCHVPFMLQPVFA